MGSGGKVSIEPEDDDDDEDSGAEGRGALLGAGVGLGLALGVAGEGGGGEDGGAGGGGLLKPGGRIDSGEAMAIAGIAIAAAMASEPPVAQSLDGVRFIGNIRLHRPNRFRTVNA